MRTYGIVVALTITGALLVSGHRTAMAQVRSAPAASAEWTKTEQAAERQGRAVLYLSIAGVDVRLKEAFRKTYPKIQLDVIRQPTGELISRLDAERQASSDGADVVYHTDRAWFDHVSSQLVPATGPALSLYKGTKNAFSGDRFFTAMIAPLSLAYNTQVLTSLGVAVPTGWEHLYNPKFANGLVGLPESGSAVVTLQCYYNIAQTHGMGLFEQIGKLKPRMYPGIGPTVQAIAAGAHAVGLVGTAAPADLIKAGAPIKQIIPTNPSCYYGYFVGQVRWSKRPEAGQVLLNWILSRAGQEAVHGWGYSGSPLENIPGALRIKPGEPLMDGVATPAQGEFSRRFSKAIGG